MISASLAALSLAGFAGSNALETALMTLSVAHEKKLVARMRQSRLPNAVSRWYARAFDAWKRHPQPFLMATLIFSSAFSMLWCLVGLQELQFALWAPVVVGVVLFLAGDLVPKVVARRFPEAVLLACLIPFYIFFSFMRGLLMPLAGIFERWTHWHLPAWLHYPMTEAEIKRILADAELTQDLKPRSRLVLEAMLEFSSRRVKEAMRPAYEVFFVSLKDTDTQTLIPKILATGFSRIPVSRDGNFQNMTGVLYVKDLLFTFATSGLVHLQDILRDCPTVEEGEKLGPLLSRFREGGIHIALVRNKNGHLSGIISLEDILEELVGEIKDEFAPS